jgi:rhodanese-related sulfurtransferase
MFKIVKCAVLAVAVSSVAVSVEAGLGDFLKTVTEPGANNQQQESAKKDEKAAVKNSENACPKCNGQGSVTRGLKSRKCKACGGTGVVQEKVVQEKKEATVEEPVAEPEPRTVLDDISMSELNRYLGGNNKCCLLDVREPDEFSSGHIKGAVNVPVGRIAARIASVCSDKNCDIYVYCQSGRRSRTAAQRLASMGYKKVHNVLGGVNSWNGKLVK